MAVVMPTLPPIAAPPWPMRRFTVSEYHRMIDLRILREGECVVLLEGWVVFKGTHVPRELATQGLKARLRRFTVDEYHRMIQAGVIQEDEPYELLEGWIVEKMSRHPPHDLALGLLDDAIVRLSLEGWFRRGQSAITTTDSEPEPDFSLIRGSRRDFGKSHPGPSEIGLVVEVADSSLERDRSVKARIYARASVPVYWILNSNDEQVEVYTDPTGDCDEPTYRQRRDFHRDTTVPVVLNGVEVARIAVGDILP